MVVTNSIAASRINSPRKASLIYSSQHLKSIDLSVNNPTFSTPGTQHLKSIDLSVNNPTFSTPGTQHLKSIDLSVNNPTFSTPGTQQDVQSKELEIAKKSFWILDKMGLDEMGKEITVKYWTRRPKVNQNN